MEQLVRIATSSFARPKIRIAAHYQGIKPIFEILEARNFAPFWERVAVRGGFEPPVAFRTTAL